MSKIFQILFQLAHKGPLQLDCIGIGLVLMSLNASFLRSSARNKAMKTQNGSCSLMLQTEAATYPLLVWPSIDYPERFEAVS